MPHIFESHKSCTFELAGRCQVIFLSQTPCPDQPDFAWQHLTFVGFWPAAQVYNENIFDLLDEPAPGAVGPRPALKLKEDAQGRIFVAGLSEVCCVLLHTH
jgi:hypothetical protein